MLHNTLNITMTMVCQKRSRSCMLIITTITINIDSEAFSCMQLHW